MGKKNGRVKRGMLLLLPLLPLEVAPLTWEIGLGGVGEDVWEEYGSKQYLMEVVVVYSSLYIILESVKRWYVRCDVF